MRIDSTFRDGVIERYGHCGDGLVGRVRLIAGAGHMELWERRTIHYSVTVFSHSYVAGGGLTLGCYSLSLCRSAHHRVLATRTLDEQYM